MLPDGIYDAFVVWAETVGEDEISLELAITTGVHKGEMVSVRMRHPRPPARGAFGRGAVDPFDLVGLPCRLVVEDGSPRLELETQS
jgi:hypothetical protein